MELRYDGRVVVVTGAGRGLGREYALQFASRGASVVVNDLGGDMKGSGKSASYADDVVNEIRRAGGTAVANYDSVTEGEKIIDTAIKNFGRVDVVINNAGILRDRKFENITDNDWDTIHRVHVFGSFKVSKAAWSFMKKQRYGRIIMVTSAAGVYGNFGQANYSAAKLAVVGLCNTLAIEGGSLNIHSNTICPFAASRLTAKLPSEVMGKFKVEDIPPLVVYLCHESCQENGGLFEVGGGWISKLRWQRTNGVVIPNASAKTAPESVQQNWDKITDWQDATNPASTSAFFRSLTRYIAEELGEEDDKNNSINVVSKYSVGKAMSYKIPDTEFIFSSRDIIIYALGIGMKVNDDNLQFLYEGHENFCTFPSFAAIICFSGVGNIFASCPGFNIDPTKIVHGEQYIELYKPLPTSGSVRNSSKIVEILDKGKGAVVVTEGKDYSAINNEKLCMNQFVTYIQKAGGFGGKRQSTAIKQAADTPARPPDAIIKEIVPESQAALYRMSGDLNPLHIDSQFAALGGFPRPILHGLCTMGYATRHVMKHYGDNDVKKFKSMKVRFMRPVIPGQVLITEMWKEIDRIIFQCKVEGNNTPVVRGGYIELNSPNEVAMYLQSSIIFERMKKEFLANPSIINKFNCKYLWNITNEKGQKVVSWVIDLKSQNPSVTPGSTSTAVDCTLTTSDDDFVALATNKLNAQKAFFNGKLKVSGNIMLAQKLENLFGKSSKL
ncbi:uncharacterized protein TRIADDRAFT_19721 [Trichoplax adhaerens]|uniref:Peroxisomal multifunctional enzyme type 2 n=1 Tax=Trichoplax adhaerens TaxID=10228 RepID=B3RJ25_TRIAD|nr:hypothetical protein TRIADDRAFT_19721 [Trichoplax adhaerens]EDV29791.1 hypothetical protein TRIADDRAFT_19721 [Trichoplax adhaerens]|eukprot:XP_002108993.1 hypothetical protein TRIADDRAFT_19721 [Trichoplax adhaerens]